MWDICYRNQLHTQAKLTKILFRMHLLFRGTVCVFYAQKQTGRVLSECLLAVSLLCGYPRVSVCVQHVPERCATPRVFKPQEADVADACSSHPTSSVFALHHLPKKKKKQLPCGGVSSRTVPFKIIIRTLIRGPRQGHQKADMSWHTFRGPNQSHFSCHCVQEGLMCNTVAQRCTCTRA